MTREEALKVASEMHGWLKTDREKEALETLIPELKESEDERIIKTLQEYVKNRNWPLNGPTQDEAFAWLEKQKQKSLNISAASEWLRKHVSAYMNSEYNEFHKCVEYDGSIDKERLINDFEEAMQRGQKPRINIDQLKSLMLQYLQEAANEKDDSDIEADTDKWARKILGYVFEQKPTWSDEDEAHRDFILESLEDQIRFCKKDAEGANYAKQIRTAQNWVKSIPERFNIQPKPECDNETEVQKAYREGKNAGRKEVFDHPEYYGLQLRRMYDYETGEKNPEWSEDDGKTRDVDVFDPKPGEKFWVRCKTEKKDNLWFDKDDERPAYAVDADGIITYIVHIKKDGTGNCVSYQNKEKFLETFEIIEKL